MLKMAKNQVTTARTTTTAAAMVSGMLTTSLSGRESSLPAGALASFSSTTTTASTWTALVGWQRTPNRSPATARRLLSSRGKWLKIDHLQVRLLKQKRAKCTSCSVVTATEKALLVLETNDNAPCNHNNKNEPGARI